MLHLPSCVCSCPSMLVFNHRKFPTELSTTYSLVWLLTVHGRRLLHKWHNSTPVRQPSNNCIWFMKRRCIKSAFMGEKGYEPVIWPNAGASGTGKESSPRKTRKKKEKRTPETRFNSLAGNNQAEGFVNLQKLGIVHSTPKTVSSRH